jgi:hypothetical protein
VESNVQIIDKRGVDKALAGDRKAAQEGRSHVQVHHLFGGTDGIAWTLALIHVHLHILGIEFRAWDGGNDEQIPVPHEDIAQVAFLVVIVEQRNVGIHLRVSEPIPLG